MKKIYLLIFIVLVALQLKAQLILDEWGDILPFSLAEGYKAEIEAYNIPSFIIPKMNNDSLCRKYNKGKTFEELGDDYIGGMDLHHEPISLKENGICIKLRNGKLWRYAIEGKSAGGIGFDFGFPKLPKGTYIAVFAPDTTNLIQPPEIFHSENLLERHKKRGLRGLVYGKKLVLEYYEPDTLKEKEDIIIKRIGYEFVGFGNQNPSSYNESGLKSGYWGSSGYSQCQKDVICTDIGNYQNEAKSVVYLDEYFEIDEDDNGYSERHHYRGTGFFLNKVGGYGNNDYPILVTAGHLYSYYKLGLTPIDLISSITKFFVVTKYQNAECGTDDTGNRGIVLPGSFNRIALGSSYDLFGLPQYSPNHDYAVLQAGSNVNKLSSYDLTYGAWTKNHDFNNSSNVGYFCIHHPEGDVKKINIDNDNANKVDFDGFELKYDLGITEHGSSGAPIFNSSRQIVGFHVGSSGNKACNLIGQIISTNGTFNNLYYEISPSLDPAGTGSAQSSNPQPPSLSELPSHCSDCILNYDETAIDCGGADCYPCGIQDVVTIKTPMDIPGSVKSRYEIFAEPDPNTLLTLKGRSYSLEAGMNVYLKGGFVVEKGAEFYAGTNAELMSEADRGCGNYCVNAPSVEITPDGDGINDYWAFSQAFAVEYDLRIFDRNDHTYYSVNNQPILENGWTMAWDGSGADPNIMTYLGLLTLTDCNGNTHYEDFFITVWGLKSIEISEEANVLEVKSIEATDTKIEIYPNPFSDNIIINYAGNTLPLECKVMDLNGKVILHKNTSSNYETISLKSLAAGNYIISAKAGDYNLVQKLIKK